MNLKSLFCLVLIYPYFFSHIQAQEKLKLVQNFELGKTYIYSTEKNETDSENPTKARIKSLTNISFEITEENNGLKKCILRYDTTKIGGMDINLFPEHMKKMFYLNTKHQTELMIDEQGKIQDVANLEECQAFVEKIISSISNLGLNMTNEANKQMEQVIVQTSATSDLFISNYLKEVRFLLYFTGWEINLEEKETLEAEIPNPFGTGSIPSVVTVELEDIENNIAKILVKQSVESDDLQVFFEKYMNAMGVPYKENDMPILDMNIESYYMYDLGKRLIMEAFTLILNKVDEVEKTESYKIKLLEIQ